VLKAVADQPRAARITAAASRPVAQTKSIFAAKPPRLWTVVNQSNRLQASEARQINPDRRRKIGYIRLPQRMSAKNKYRINGYFPPIVAGCCFR
jgi:hypothetical protein